MYKYIAMVWKEDDSSATQAAEFVRNKIQRGSTSWEMAYKSKGLTVLHSGEDRERMHACTLKNEGGVVLGKLFKTSTGGDHLSIGSIIGEGESQRMLKTSGKHLIEHYWGRYVAFLKDANTHMKIVLKGPIEGFNCYNIDYNGVTLYFSFFEDILRLNFHKLSINWQHIAVHLKHFQLNKDETAFSELYKFKSGECWQYLRGEVTEPSIGTR